MSWVYQLTLVGVGLLVVGMEASAVEKPDVQRHLRTGSQYIKEHHYHEAMGEFQQALEANPESAAANAGMGNLYAGMKQCEQGIPYLEKALRIDPNDDTALFGLGACYMDLQRHEQAIPYLQKALQIHPGNRGAMRALAHAYVRRGIVAGKQGVNQAARKARQEALALFQQLGDQQGVNDMRSALKEIPE